MVANLVAGVAAAAVVGAVVVQPVELWKTTTMGLAAFAVVVAFVPEESLRGSDSGLASARPPASLPEAAVFERLPDLMALVTSVIRP